MSYLLQFYRQISSHELLKMIQDDVPMDGWDFIKFPSHTQAVERIVKLATEASRKRVGQQNMDGFIRVTVESMKQITQFESKTITNQREWSHLNFLVYFSKKSAVSPPPRG
ncbi:hypothetical protein AVEN_4645-1 [Araneus ventricosus]|uniref:Uncharacterized protein n=1 Tax=Araneus ventricosus TaxID=182803 RepID=A0A4Y2TFT9_ARAVE|nr:hypothetical protein AVEN_4645-1 [Araneus ventricosus]